MDLLFKQYASPLELVDLYINQGRFGEFVEHLLDVENERRKEEIEKENDNKLWIAYVHSHTELSFSDWKKQLQTNREQKHSMTNRQIENEKQKARGILKSFSLK